MALQQNGEWATHRAAFAFLRAVLRCGRGQADGFLADALAFSLSLVTAAPSTRVRAQGCVGVCECLLYSPALSTRWMAESGSLGAALEACFSVVNEKALQSVADWRCVAIGLSSLLSLPLCSLPPLLPSLLHSIVLALSYTDNPSLTSVSRGRGRGRPRVVVVANDLEDEDGDDDVYKVVRCGVCFGLREYL